MTVKELADRYGVSKTTIRNYLSAVPAECITKDSGGRIHLTAEGAETIAKLLQTRKPETANLPETENQVSANQPQTFRKVSGNSQTSPQTQLETKPQTANLADLSGVKAAIDALTRQLAEKDKQIERLQLQVTDLTDALKQAERNVSQAQLLHADSRQLLTAQEERIEVQEGDTTPDPDSSADKRHGGLWAWLTRRR